MHPSSIARLLALTLVLVSSACSRGAPAAAPPSAQITVESLVVEAACGTCQFEMPGSTCALAVRIDGRAHYVDGTTLDDHGDAHAADGFCNAVRKARVSGHLEGERFAVTSFELLPAAQ